MVSITVKEKVKIPGGRKFYVILGDGNAIAEYLVDLRDDYWEQLTSRRISEEELIKKSFEFLLERESQDDIMQEFGLPVIQQLFPEYEDAMRASNGGFAPIIILWVVAAAIFGAGFMYVITRTDILNFDFIVNSTSSLPLPTPTSTPAPVPSPVTEEISCTSDAQCPSAEYTCEAIQGVGSSAPNGGPTTFAIIKGVCKKNEGRSCVAASDCLSGLLCHDRACMSPIGRECGGPNDTSCPTDYVCIQGCGPPSSREDDPPPPYFCELKEYASKPKMCPICLAKDTAISTPSGDIKVQDVKVGMSVWSLDKYGNKIASRVVLISQTDAPQNHKVVHLVLADKREVWVSPNHPTISGGLIGELRAGDFYDGSEILKAEKVPYWAEKTYDILPDGDTGYYWANGILLGSTLK